MVWICNECSPGGAHPSFTTQLDYDRHRQKAHGESMPERAAAPVSVKVVKTPIKKAPIGRARSRHR